MLVLTRKRHQRIIVGDDIQIVICRIDRDRVQVGIEAPRDVHILREECVATQRDAKRRRAEAND